MVLEKTNLYVFIMVLLFYFGLQEYIKRCINLHTAITHYLHLDTIISIYNRNQNLINQQDSLGYSPLHLAAKFGRFEIAQFLIDMGADIDIKNNFGNTPLHIATLQDNSSIV